MLRIPKHFGIGVILLAVLLIVGLSVSSAAEKKFVLRLASVSSPDHHHNVTMKSWAADLKKFTDGRLEIRVLDGAQLGGERDYIEAMQTGTLDMCQTSTGPMSGFIPEFMVFGLPYLFRDSPHFNKVLEGSIGDFMFKKLERKGMKGLCWFDNGYRSVFNSKKPIQTPADLKGLKIRVMESPLMVQTLNHMGASATPMAYGELYSALQQGVMDGAENTPGNVLNDKFYEICKFYSLTNHFRPPGMVIISTAMWKKLPQDLQEILLTSAKGFGHYERAQTEVVVSEALRKLVEKGVKINEVDFGAFQKAVEPVYGMFEKDIGRDLIDTILGM